MFGARASCCSRRSLTSGGADVDRAPAGARLRRDAPPSWRCEKTAIEPASKSTSRVAQTEDLAAPEHGQDRDRDDRGATCSGIHERSSSASSQVRKRGSRSSAWRSGRGRRRGSTMLAALLGVAEDALEQRERHLRPPRRSLGDRAIRSSTSGRRIRSTDRSSSGARPSGSPRAIAIDRGRGRTRPAAPIDVPLEPGLGDSRRSAQAGPGRARPACCRRSTSSLKACASLWTEKTRERSRACRDRGSGPRSGARPSLSRRRGSRPSRASAALGSRRRPARLLQPADDLALDRRGVGPRPCRRAARRGRRGGRPSPAGSAARRRARRR